MKAQELRIGNYVRADGYYPFADIDSINKDFVNIGSESFAYTAIEPIPLTEDWLLKFGFEYRNSTFWISNDDYEVNKVANGFVINHVQLSSYYGAEIQYVHQLQNLYFALTNSELTIK